MLKFHDSVTAELDSFVEAYEEACDRTVQPAVEEFLPGSSHPHFAKIAGELLRVDLELSWRRGVPTPLSDYRRRFPAVLEDAQRWSELAYEEYRLRLQAGESVEASDYRDQHSVDTSAWPKRNRGEGVSGGGSLPGARQPASPAIPRRTAGAFDPTVVQKAFPKFSLRDELGRGSFGCVYLAREQDLAGRYVAFKVAAASSVEHERLAQLQHANIVPVYSVHQSAGLQGVCMPFLGRCTLADVVGRLRRHAETPQSGQDLLSTIVAHAESTVAEPLRESDAPRSDAIETGERIELVSSIRDQYQRSSYVDAVVWIGAQMAAGLAHAHERGILHRDLKPANVLLADDGRPMLLDFNLADRVRDRGERVTLVGGTIPYMAPEQLDALDTGVGIDARCDIFSLGVVLFELLTRELPFASDAAGRSNSAQLAAQRRQGPPSARALNSAIPRSLDGLIARCLAPQPELRYQTAEELRTDLERHLANQPLLHAPDRSPPERCRKWVRRHPRLSSAASLGTAAATIVAVLGVGWSVRERHIAGLEAEANFQRFISAAPSVEAPLSVPGGDLEVLHEGIRAAEEQLARYAVAPETDWRAQPPYARLTPAQQRSVDEHLTTTLFLLSGAQRRRAAAAQDNGEQLAAQRLAREVNALASNVARGHVTNLEAALGRQRLKLAAVKSGKSEAKLADVEQSTTTDAQAETIELLLEGRYDAALPRLIEWRDRTPTDLTAWLLVGNAHAALGATADAEECYTTAIVQRPKFPYSYFLRGLARHEMGMYQAAADDFTMVLKLGGCPMAARVNRALALYGAKELNRSLADLDVALQFEGVPTRIYFVRAQVRRELGDGAGAAEDFEQGLRSPPNDSESWLACGMARMKTDPEHALADFRRALELDPGSQAATQNIVHVLADRLGRERDALPYLDKVLAAKPHDARLLASRAMIHARLGDSDLALTDARAAIEAPHEDKLLIQIAGVHARVADEDGQGARAEEGLAFVAQALRRDPSLAELAADDPDLAPLRKRAEFDKILQSARVLRGAEAISSQSRPTAIP